MLCIREVPALRMSPARNYINTANKNVIMEIDMRIKKILTATLACVCAASLTACGGTSGEQTSASASNEASVSGSASDGTLEQIDVVLDWYPNAIHTFLYYAQENGYFADEGLEVNLISPAESIDAITFVSSGRAQIGLTYPVEIVQAQENGMPVKALASVCAQQLDCMCSLASNTDITADMSSLKGKTVGYSGTSLAEATIRTITRNAGLEDSDYELLNVGYDLVTSLTTGSVDLVVGTFINDEVITMQNEGYDLNIYYEQDYGFPEMYGLVMAVNEDSYNASPEVYEGFLAACEKGFEDMKSDEDAALELIMSEMNSDDNPLDEEQQRESYEILMGKMETDDEPFLSMSSEKWQAIISWMYESGLIESEISPSDVMIQNNE